MKYIRYRYRSISMSVVINLIGLLFVACQSQNSVGADNPIRCEDFRRTPVLFIHGSGLDSRSWDEMINRFTQFGYPASYLLAIDMLPNDGDNVVAAESFIKKGMETLLRTSRRAIESSSCSVDVPMKADLVAHSMGAFSSRWYAAHIQPERVRRLITLAGANHGTDALCGQPGRGNLQMCPAFSSRADAMDVQQQLNGTAAQPKDETPFGVGTDTNPSVRVAPDSIRRIAYFSIRLEHDEWIKPSASSILDGSGETSVVDVSALPVTQTSNGNFIFIADTNHDGLPSHPQLIDLVLRLL